MVMDTITLTSMWQQKKKRFLLTLLFSIKLLLVNTSLTGENELVFSMVLKNTHCCFL